MKKKIIAILLCGMLASSMLTACGNKNADKEPSVSSEKEAAQTLENGLPEDARSMEHVLEALADVGYESGNEYAVWDEDYFWNACAYLVNEDGTANGDGEKTDSGIQMPEDRVKEYANALFGAYDGNAKDLPDIPEGMDNVSLDLGTGKYIFAEIDTDAYDLEIKECTDNQDGTYEITGSLRKASDGEDAADFSAAMQGTSYESSGDLHYRYMITTFEITERYSSESQDQQKPSENDTAGDSENTGGNQSGEQDAQDDGSQSETSQKDPGDTSQGQSGSASQGSSNTGRQITKDQAMALVEKQFGANGETDPETGNVNTYAYEGIATVNGSKYYNFRMSWLVEDHVSYLNNIFVSMDGSQILEGSRGTDGNWEIYE